MRLHISHPRSIFVSLSFFFFFSSLFFDLGIVLAERTILDTSAQLRELLIEAEALKLHEERDWRNLLQYWDNALYTTTSRVDDEEYFLAKNGKRDPKAELEATLRAFFEEQDGAVDGNQDTSSPDSLSTGSLSPEKLSPEKLSPEKISQCRFAARFLWLDQELGLRERGIVREAPCARYREWKESLSIDKVYLIFPAAYLNNPASMFGHTLFRLDSLKSKNNPLLSYAANFGAATGNDGGVLFAVKGLSGGYPASFSVEPYYETVKRYGDIEHRDIWEYELLLTPQEIERFQALLWELGSTYFDYYFFDENCSFYVLSLLDFVRPSLNLLSEFSYWVIPSDTLKLIQKREGLVGQVTYRPSLSSKLSVAADILDADVVSEIKKRVKGGEEVQGVETRGAENSEIDETKARSLEFAYDYLEYLASKGDVTETDGRKQAREILSLRSSLPALKPLEIEEPKFKPEDTHASGRVLLTAGGRERTAFSNLSLKPAYHDALDASEGFRDGAAIDFFHTNVRLYEEGRFVLQSFYPVAIQSYTPWNRVFKPVSWDVSAGLERQYVPKDHRNKIEGSLGGFFETSAGITLPLFSTLKMSLLGSLRGSYTPAYPSEDFALGAGPKARLTASFSESLRVLVEGSLIRYVPGETHTLIRSKGDIQYDLGKNLSLGKVVPHNFFVRAGVAYERSFNTDIREFSAGGGWYF